MQRRGGMTMCLLAVAMSFAAIGLNVQQAKGAEPGLVPQWIWSRRLTGRETITFDYDFRIPGPVQQALLRGRADDAMTVWLKQGDGPATQIAEIVSSTESRQIDVTRALHEGTNTLILEASNKAGQAGVLLRLEIMLTDGRKLIVATDPRWSATEAGGTRAAAVSHGLEGCPPWGDPQTDTPDYHQWKAALGTPSATSAAQVAALPGFEVELVRSSQPGEGSWISLEFLPKGKLVIGREGKGLLRYTLPYVSTAKSPEEKRKAENGTMEVINNDLLECRGLLYAYDSLYAHANNSKGLYRLRDTNGDDSFDEVKLLKATPGNVGHGRNDLALGPDGLIYAICGNDTRLPADYDPAASPFRNYADDRLLKVAWDRYLFDSNATLPGGHVARTDVDGKSWEVVAGGLRNPYGLAFSADDILFTFDADNEGDLGTPWYRPTAVNYILPGGDYGWRQGTGMRPRWFPDCLPATLEIGKASPTGVKFGTLSNFPPGYRNAMFILDWAYGVIYAVHLLPTGAGFTATAEVFVAGKPLNVTDVEFGLDGAMYFVTGGRGTQSGLYRVRFTGPAPLDDFAVPESVEYAGQMARRPRLPTAKLDPHDRWQRHRAQLRFERPPDVGAISDRTRWSLTSALARARIGKPTEQPDLLRAVLADPCWSTATTGAARPAAQVDDELLATRIVAISLARHGRPDAALTAEILSHVESRFPGDVFPINQLQCELLVFLESPLVVSKTIPLLASATTQEETLCWLLLLRNVKHGWSLDSRRTFFHRLQEAEAFEGGREVTTALYSIRVEALQTLTEDERRELGDVVKFRRTATAVKPIERPLVREWKPEDVAEILAAGGTRDLARGQDLFAKTQCVACHRVRGQGTPVGPDLAGAALRFGPKDLLETILVPSKSIDEKYRNQTFQLRSGKVVTGRLITGDDKHVLVSPNPLEPDLIESVELGEVESRTPSAVSPMPAGLLNTLTAAEILDLLAYLDAVALRRPIPAKGSP